MSSKAKPIRFLSKIVEGLETSRVVLLQDSLQWKALPLLCSFLERRNRSSSAPQTVLLLLESEATCLPLPLSTQVRVLSLFQDLDPDSDLGEGDDLLASHAFWEQFEGNFSNSYLVIDSFTPLLMRYNLREVASFLNRMSLMFKSVLFVLCGDVIPETFVCSLRQIATCAILLNYHQNLNCVEAQIVLKKRNKRSGTSVQTFSEYFNVSPEFTIDYVDVKRGETAKKEPPPQPLTVTGLPFNLNLRGDQKEAKDKLVLPYERQEEASRVYYEPDKDDDIDEEDPDDDLDI